MNNLLKLQMQKQLCLWQIEVFWYNFTTKPLTENTYKTANFITTCRKLCDHFWPTTI